MIFVGARIGGEQFSIDQGVQDPVYHCLGEFQLSGDSGDPQGPGAVGEYHQHVGDPGRRLGASQLRHVRLS